MAINAPVVGVSLLGMGLLMASPMTWTKERREVEAAAAEVAAARIAAKEAGLILDKAQLSPVNQLGGKNAAEYVLKAAQELEADREMRIAARDLISNAPQYRRSGPTEKELMAMLAPVYRLAEQAAACEVISYPRGASTGVVFNEANPGLTTLRLMGRLMAIRGQSRAGQGDISGALDDFERTLHLSDHIGSEPVVLSGINQAGLRLTVIQRLETLVRRNPSNAPLLKRIKALVERRSDSVHPRHALKGEAALDYAFILDPHTYTLEGLSRLVPALKLEPDGSLPAAFYTFVPKGVPKDRLAKAYEARYLQAWTAMYRAAKSEADPAKAALDSEDAYNATVKIEDQACALPVHLITWAGVPTRWANHAVRTRSLRAAIDCLLHRLEQGALPKSLEDIGAAHKDPWTGRTLVYRVEERGFTIYSTGPNQQDDGATGATDRLSGEPHDVAFKITL